MPLNDTPDPIYALVLILVALLLSGVGLYNVFRRGLPLPPGPRKLPILGNILNSPGSHPWLHYTKWAEELDSDIIYLHTLGSSHIVLSSFEAANELLNRRSAIYSNRPRHCMAVEIMGQTCNIGLIPYGSQWRARRRVFWQEFMPANSYLHEAAEIKNARYLLRLILKDPDNFLAHIRYTLGASILEISYGIVPQPRGDPIIALGDRVLRRLGETMIYGAFLVDLIPALKHLPRWMPGTNFQSIGDVARQEVAELVDIPYSIARKLIAQGNAVPSFVSRALSKFVSRDISNEEESALKDAVAVGYEGGIETTPSALSSFFVAMLFYPDVQARAQKELDENLDRLPELSDRPDLPYFNAVMLEVIRWQPIIPLGAAHAVITEDEYKGFYIPKNSTVSANIWAILNDRNRFPNPREFRPERFLVDGKINQNLEEEVMSTFGFGRRICPGRFFAMESLWINMASILYTYRISGAVDKSGQAIIPNIDYESSFVRQVCPFRCAIQPRSEKARTMIEDSELLQ